MTKQVTLVPQANAYILETISDLGVFVVIKGKLNCRLV